VLLLALLLASTLCVHASFHRACLLMQLHANRMQMLTLNTMSELLINSQARATLTWQARWPASGMHAHLFLARPGSASYVHLHALDVQLLILFMPYACFHAESIIVHVTLPALLPCL
jgi:hypothetical protein